MPPFRRRFLDTAESFTDLPRELLDAGAVGLDVEMGQRIRRLPGGVTSGEQILALIQIAGNEATVAVDPLRVGDLSPLNSLMSSSSVKVVLGGATDIQLLEKAGVRVENVVDLAEVAVSVFGHREEGMRALAQRALGIEIDKSIRREDWLRRPINPAMLNYAYRDAELTLCLYAWFQQNHPDAVQAHTRKQYTAELPPGVPSWLRKYLTKRLDALRLLRDEGIDTETEAARLADDIRLAWEGGLAPGQQRRLLRLIGELRLAQFYDDVVPYLEDASSVFRAAGARTLGRLGDERARQLLEKLLEDDIIDVRSAAQLGLRDLNQGVPDVRPTVGHEEEEPSLKPEAMAALAQLQKEISDVKE